MNKQYNNNYDFTNLQFQTVCNCLHILFNQIMFLHYQQITFSSYYLNEKHLKGWSHVLVSVNNALNHSFIFEFHYFVYIRDSSHIRVDLRLCNLLILQVLMSYANELVDAFVTVVVHPFIYLLWDLFVCHVPLCDTIHKVLNSVSSVQ